MWLFGRKAKAQALSLPDGLKGKAAEPQVLTGPHLIRRTEITVEREWMSTVRRTSESAGPVESAVEKAKGDELD